jgi:hypothetical protein
MTAQTKRKGGAMLIHCDCPNCGTMTDDVRYDWETGGHIPPTGWTVEEDAYRLGSRAWPAYYCPACSEELPEQLRDDPEIFCVCQLDDEEER